MAERRFSAGGVVIKKERARPKVLLIKDSYGRWTWAKGHIEKGESRKDTLVRELAEELGIEVVESDFLESYEDKDPTYGRDYIHHIYIVQDWNGEPYNKNPREHDTIGWFAKEECRHLRMHGEVKRIILEKVEF